VRRREFVTLLGGAVAAWPLVARAQQSAKLPTIGFVGPSTATVDRPLTGPFVQRLAELGWVAGRSIVIDYRPAEGLVERAGEIVAEFVRLKVDVIVTGGDAQALAAKQANAPCRRPIEQSGDIVAYPILGGLHHRYARI
jgi:putative ABC transport system substrate-binding protein